MATSTKERIVTEAMRLFGEHGYRGTTIARIEEASGLTPGAGGLYHHFDSKEAVLAAGIERQLARLEALRDIRNVLSPGPGSDLAAELVLTARYVLAELDSESELLRILAAETRNRPELLTTAVEHLVTSTFTGFTDWIAGHAPDTLDAGEARALAAIGLGSLLSARLMPVLLTVPFPVDDEQLVASWVRTMVAALQG